MPSTPLANRRVSDGATFRNTDRIHRIGYRLGLYKRIVAGALGRVPVRELVRTQFPFWMRDAPMPPLLSVELTNHCNLACGYCTNPTTTRPRGMMSEATFSRVVDEIARIRVPRVALCGNGESTLHPRFPEYVRRLARAAPWVSLTSNWQRIRDEIVLACLESLQLINISVDGGGRVDYERRRLGGRFEALLGNLDRLASLKRSTGSRTLVNLRVMLDASDLDREKEILGFWEPYADVVSKQYILDFRGHHPLGLKPDLEGRCTLPFKKLDLHWNGVVNLCSYSWMQTHRPEGLVLGNVDDTMLAAMWNGPVMRRYRAGHRRRDETLIPVCRGCPGRT